MAKHIHVHVHDDDLEWTSMRGPDFRATGTMEQVIQKVKQRYPSKQLEFEGMTDQIDVYEVVGGKRRRFMTLMP